MSALDPVLNPRSIVIVGASNSPVKRGYQAIRKLREAGFAGEILGVNPKGGEVLGVTCYPSVESLPHATDLALICTPAQTVPALVDACGRKGIRGAVVLAGGFGESGEAGRQLEAEMVAAARRWGLRVSAPTPRAASMPPRGSIWGDTSACRWGESVCCPSPGTWR